MKRLAAIIVFITSVAVAAAQERDSILAAMNKAKLDPDCLWGSSAMSTPEQARQEAFKDLSARLNDSLMVWGYKYISSADRCPETTIHYLTLQKSKTYYRALAYINKNDIAAEEQAFAEAAAAAGYRDEAEKMLRRIAVLENVKDIGKLLADSPIRALVHIGRLSFDTPQQYVDDSFLVYYEPPAGKVLEIMTPRYDSGVRKNLLTGEVADPMKYRKASIVWIYFDSQFEDLIR